MRSKLMSHGARIFDTYELLEMLLYYVIPYKDTNPIAKRLLYTFGTLDGVFRADREELMQIDGVGDRCADFIKDVGMIMYENDALELSVAAPVMDDYNEAGRFIAEHFSSVDSTVCILLLDNGMRLIDVRDVKGHSFSSGGLKARFFIDAALSVGATVAIIAHHNVNGPLYPTESDMATDKMLRAELSRVGVAVAEHYVICGNKYIGVKTDLALSVSVHTPEFERFCDSKPTEMGGMIDE